MGDARIVHLSMRVYRVLLASYPPAFRKDYAVPMLQAYGDYTRRIYQQRGLPGMLLWWVITLFDYLNSVVEEHLQRMTSMTKEKFIRLGGWAFMFAALIMVAAFALGGLYDTPFGRTRAYETLQGISYAVLALSIGLGMFALRAYYKEQLGALGNVSLVAGGVVALVSFLGLVAYAIVTFNDLGWFFFIFGLLGMSVALLLFGVDAAKRRILPRWNSLPFLTGLPDLPPKT